MIACSSELANCFVHIIDQQLSCVLMRHILQQQSFYYFNIFFQAMFSFEHFCFIKLINLLTRFSSLVTIESFATFQVVSEFLVNFRIFFFGCPRKKVLILNPSPRWRIRKHIEKNFPVYPKTATEREMKSNREAFCITRKYKIKISDNGFPN